MKRRNIKRKQRRRSMHIILWPHTLWRIYLFINRCELCTYLFILFSSFSNDNFCFGYCFFSAHFLIAKTILLKTHFSIGLCLCKSSTKFCLSVKLPLCNIIYVSVFFLFLCYKSIFYWNDLPNTFFYEIVYASVCF